MSSVDAELQCCYCSLVESPMLSGLVNMVHPSSENILAMPDPSPPAKQLCQVVLPCQLVFAALCVPAQRSRQPPPRLLSCNQIQFLPLQLLCFLLDCVPATARTSLSSAAHNAAHVSQTRAQASAVGTCRVRRIALSLYSRVTQPHPFIYADVDFGSSGGCIGRCSRQRLKDEREMAWAR